MLELMIDEPRMEYAEVEALLDVVDQHDKDTLMAYVNTLTSEKMSVAQAVANERMDEVDGMRTKMMRDMKLG
jgi:Mor family transcriptional regulator